MHLRMTKDFVLDHQNNNDVVENMEEIQRKALTLKEELLETY